MKPFLLISLVALGACAQQAPAQLAPAQPSFTELQFDKALKDEMAKAAENDKKRQDEYDFHVALLFCSEANWKMAHCDVLKHKEDQIDAEERRSREELRKAQEFAEEKTVAAEAAKLSQSH